jgi:hypothetical protein
MVVPISNKNILLNCIKYHNANEWVPHSLKELTCPEKLHSKLNYSNHTVGAV